MTAKEKANSLVESFYYACGLHTKSKDCALACVNEILKALESDRIIYGSIYRYEESDFWQEVKKEIELL